MDSFLKSRLEICHFLKLQLRKVYGSSDCVLKASNETLKSIQYKISHVRINLQAERHALPSKV